MAYLTIIDACFEGRHDACTETENIPEQRDGEIVCGGGHCVCTCHNRVSLELYQSVYDGVARGKRT